MWLSICQHLESNKSCLNARKLLNGQNLSDKDIKDISAFVTRLDGVERDAIPRITNQDFWDDTEEKFIRNLKSTMVENGFQER